MNSHSTHHAVLRLDVMNVPMVWMLSLAMAEYPANANPTHAAIIGVRCVAAETRNPHISTIKKLRSRAMTSGICFIRFGIPASPFDISRLRTGRT